MSSNRKEDIGVILHKLAHRLADHEAGRARAALKPFSGDAFGTGLCRRCGDRLGALMRHEDQRRPGPTSGIARHIGLSPTSLSRHGPPQSAYFRWEQVSPFRLGKSTVSGVARRLVQQDTGGSPPPAATDARSHQLRPRFRDRQFFLSLRAGSRKRARSAACLRCAGRAWDHPCETVRKPAGRTCRGARWAVARRSRAPRRLGAAERCSSSSGSL